MWYNYFVYAKNTDIKLDAELEIFLGHSSSRTFCEKILPLSGFEPLNSGSSAGHTTRNATNPQIFGRKKVLEISVGKRAYCISRTSTERRVWKKQTYCISEKVIRRSKKGIYKNISKTSTFTFRRSLRSIRKLC